VESKGNGRAKPRDDSNDRRRFRRVQVPMFFRDARSRDVQRPVMDVSVGGLRVYSDEPFGPGVRYKIELFLPDGRSLNCVVETAWTEKLPAGSPAAYDVGLRLVGTDVDDMQHIKDLIEDAPER
jgi:hypothetical protein